MMIKRRRLTIGICVLLIVPGALAYVVHLRDKSAVENCKAKLWAAGERLTIEELRQSPLVPEQNNTNLFWRAASYFSTNRSILVLETNDLSPMHQIGSGRAILVSARPGVRSDRGSNSWEQVHAALDEESKALGLFQQLSRSPAPDFQLNYYEGLSLRLPHLLPFRVATLRFSERAVCNLSHADTTSAASDIQSMLGLVGKRETRHPSEWRVFLALTQGSSFLATLG